MGRKRKIVFLFAGAAVLAFGSGPVREHFTGQPSQHDVKRAPRGREDLERRLELQSKEMEDIARRLREGGWNVDRDREEQKRMEKDLERKFFEWRTA